jgi:SEC-C motif-containing protein
MREEWQEDECPCGSGELFKVCCDPYIAGAELAPTAEKLMRSRYSAFVVQEPEYIFETHSPDTRSEVDLDEITAWSTQSIWEGLNILNVEDGGESDDTGVVEFVARYTVGNKGNTHHERSSFQRKEGKWWFMDGTLINDTVRREGAKVGRNDPCPCGSGKKFKKCCSR